MKTFQQYLEERMQDPEFAREYEAIQPEMDAIRREIDERIERERHNKTEAEAES